MSSVKSPAERSAQDETVRRQRETYTKREAESAKRQGQQVRHMTETHQEELQRLRDEHNQQLENIKQKSKETFTRRDMKYQRDVEELRDMHAKQIQRVAQESESRLKSTESALGSEINRLNETSVSQKKILRDGFEEQINQYNQRQSELAKGSQDQLRNESANIKSKMKETHEKEVKAISKDRQQVALDHQREVTNIRKGKDHQIKVISEQSQNEKERLLSSHWNTIQRERGNHRAQNEYQHEAVEDGMKRVQARYEKATEKIRAESESSRDGLTSSVNGRLNGRLRSLETEYQNLKEDQPRVRAQLEQKKAREVQNVRDSMQANIENLEDARKQTVSDSNEKTKQEIERLNKTNTSILGQAHNFYQDKIMMDNLRAEQRYAQAKLDGDKAISQEKTTAESRIERLQGNSEIEKGKLRSYFDRSLAAMKENFEVTLREMRQQSMTDKEQMFSTFARQSQEADAKFQQKLASVTNRYELQIAEIKDEYLKERQADRTMGDRARKELEKKTTMDVKTQASQYEHRIAKLEESHRRELDSMKIKHEESLANLIKRRQT